MKTHNEPADWDDVKAKIMQRHVVEGECWEWKSFSVRRGVPILHHKTVDGRDVASPVRKLVALLWGRNVPADNKCLPSCGNPRCVNPEHIIVVRQKAHLKRAARAAHAAGNSSLRVAKIAQTRREKHAKLDWDKVRAIRDSEDTYAALSATYGVSKTVIGKVKRHEVWVDYAAKTNPFAGLFS